MPKPQRGRQLSEAERVEIAKKVCEMYATDQYTIAVCLSANGIESESTWRKWQDEIAEIAQLYRDSIEKKGKAYRENLKYRARTAIEKHIEGYNVEVEETEETEQVGKDGGVVKTTKTKKKQLYVRPSVQAAIFVLTNMDGDNFQYRPEPKDEKRLGEKLLSDWTDEEIEAELKRWKDDD